MHLQSLRGGDLSDAELRMLQPIDKGRYWLMRCPACGRREAYLYKGSCTLRCNRLNKCGFSYKLGRTAAMPYSTHYLPAMYADDAAEPGFAPLDQAAPASTTLNPSGRMIGQHRLSARERMDLKAPLARYCAALTDDSPGALYLKWRKISISLARKYQIGYSAPNQWCHFKNDRPVRQWKHGHLIFPLHNAKGKLVNLQARALDSRGYARQLGLSHDILPGLKGLFNGQVFLHAKTVFLCEGVLDALSLMQMGISNVAATIGAGSIPWLWFHRLENLVICFDLDPAGEAQYCQVARDAGLSGLTVYRLPKAIYGHKNDLNDALSHDALCSLALFDFCDEYELITTQDRDAKLSKSQLARKLIAALDGEEIEAAF